jgi:hypothetical protein
MNTYSNFEIDTLALEIIPEAYKNLNLKAKELLDKMLFFYYLL